MADKTTMGAWYAAMGSALIWVSACGSGSMGLEPGAGNESSEGGVVLPSGNDGSAAQMLPKSDAASVESVLENDGSRRSLSDAGADVGISSSRLTGEAGPDLDARGGLGFDASGYPAFTPDFGQLVNHGEAVLSAPVIVSITWDRDPSQATFDQFVDAIGASDYWKATTSEYGVGTATSGAANHVHMATAAPATMQDADFKNLVKQNAGNAWPAPTDQSIYAFFVPPGTNVQVNGAIACNVGIAGYHDQVMVGTTLVAYAVVPSCAFRMSAQDGSTSAMSHELIEAVTDPWPNLQMPGLIGFDKDHFAFDWFQSFQSENGDSCEFYRTSFFHDMEPAFSYYVQRTWSNANAKLGRNPCVPAPQGAAYFNVTPLNLTTVDVDTSMLRRNGMAMMPTKGVHILKGQTGTIEVGFYSDAPTGPWMLDYIEGGPVNAVKPPRLTVAIDKTTGSNGDRAKVTVTVNIVGPIKAELLSLRSTLGMDKHYMPIVIGSQ